jgi:uncharacterized membrane protein YdbT with pleckstrin-like domain
VPFPRKLLNEGEEVVLDLRPHWAYFFGPALAIIAAVVLGVMALANDWADWGRIAIGLGLLVSLGWLAGRFVRWASTNFVVTTDRLIYRHGVLSKQGIEIPLERVNTVFFKQRLIERLFGAGDLIIESAGERGEQHFYNIRRPSLVQNEIYRQMEANENRKFDRLKTSLEPARADAGAPDVTQQLERLHDLYQRGIVSDEEYRLKKAQLLERM